MQSTSCKPGTGIARENPQELQRCFLMLLRRYGEVY